VLLDWAASTYIFRRPWVANGAFLKKKGVGLTSYGSGCIFFSSKQNENFSEKKQE